MAKARQRSGIVKKIFEFILTYLDLLEFIGISSDIFEFILNYLDLLE